VVRSPSSCVQYLENVSGKAVRVVRTPQGEWRATPIALPANGVLKIASAGGGTDDAMLSFESLTSPLTLYYSSADGVIEQIYTTPAAYAATDVVVEQRFATSTDGTKVPYFVMGRKSVLAQGNAPTVQYAYGGFLAAACSCSPTSAADRSTDRAGTMRVCKRIGRRSSTTLSRFRKT